MAATNDTPFRIRPAAKKDRAALRRLFAYTGMVGTDKCDWKIVLDRKEGYEVLVVEEREKAVCGYALCQSKWEGKIHLQDLVVDASARGRGIGRGLLQYLIEQGRLRGSREIYLEVKSTNIPALRLYESTGFRKRFVVPGLLEGADLVAMYLPIGSGDR